VIRRPLNRRWRFSLSPGEGLSVLVVGGDEGIDVFPKLLDGAELALSWAPIESLLTTGSVTYLDTNIEKSTGLTANGQPEAFDDRSQLPFTSHWSNAPATDFSDHLVSDWRWFLGASLKGRIAQMAVIGATPDPFIPSYALIDL